MSNEAQVDLWTENWSNSPYTVQDFIDGDKWVSVKDSPLLPSILKYLPVGSTAIEAGCGMGQWVIYLADKGYKIKGIDYSAETIEKIKVDYPSYDFECGNVLAFNMEDASIDGVLSWGVVEHFIEGPHKALLETYRILKHGGFLFISVPYKNYLNVLFTPVRWMKEFFRKNSLLRKLLSKKPYKKEFFEYEFGKKVFTGHLQKAGFEILEVFAFSHERGFVNEINNTFNPKKTRNWFYKNKTGKWNGLTKTGSFFCNFLKKISPWFTPDFIYFVARKN